MPPPNASTCPLRHLWVHGTKEKSVVDFDVFRDGFTFAYHFGERKSFSTRTAGAAAQTDPLRTRRRRWRWNGDGSRWCHAGLGAASSTFIAAKVKCFDYYVGSEGCYTSCVLRSLFKNTYWMRR